MLGTFSYIGDFTSSKPGQRHLDDLRLLSSVAASAVVSPLVGKAENLSIYLQKAEVLLVVEFKNRNIRHLVVLSESFPNATYKLLLVELTIPASGKGIVLMAPVDSYTQLADPNAIFQIIPKTLPSETAWRFSYGLFFNGLMRELNDVEAGVITCQL
jgi:hypothetical protein